MGMFDWWEDAWDQFSGNTQRRQAESAVNQAGQTNLAAANSYADAILSAQGLASAANAEALQNYRNAINQALSSVPGYDVNALNQLSLAEQQQLLSGLTGAQQQATGTLDQALTGIPLAQQQATAGLNQALGSVQQAGQQTLAGLSPILGTYGQMQRDVRSGLAPYQQAAQGTLSAVNPLLVALGLKEGDASAALQRSPMYQLQKEEQERALNNQLASRGAASGRTAARMQSQAGRELLASEMEKNVNRLSGLASAGMQGAGLADQAARAGVSEIANVQQQMANVPMQLLPVTTGLQQQIANLPIQLLPQMTALQTQKANLPISLLPYAQQVNQNYYQQQRENTNLGRSDAMWRAQQQANLETQALQQATNTAAANQAAALQSAQTLANAQLANGQGQLALGMQQSQTPSMFQQLLPLATNWMLSGSPGFNFRTALGIGRG